MFAFAALCILCVVLEFLSPSSRNALLSFSIHAAALCCNVSLFWHRNSGALCMLCTRFAMSVAVATITTHNTKVLLTGCMRMVNRTDSHQILFHARLTPTRFLYPCSSLACLDQPACIHNKIEQGLQPWMDASQTVCLSEASMLKVCIIENEVHSVALPQPAGAKRPAVCTATQHPHSALLPSTPTVQYCLLLCAQFRFATLQ